MRRTARDFQFSKSMPNQASNVLLCRMVCLLWRQFGRPRPVVPDIFLEFCSFCKKNCRTRITWARTASLSMASSITAGSICLIFYLKQKFSYQRSTKGHILELSRLKNASKQLISLLMTPTSLIAFHRETNHFRMYIVSNFSPL